MIDEIRRKKLVDEGQVSPVQRLLVEPREQLFVSLNVLIFAHISSLLGEETLTGTPDTHAPQADGATLAQSTARSSAHPISQDLSVSQGSQEENGAGSLVDRDVPDVSDYQAKRARRATDCFSGPERRVASDYQASRAAQSAGYRSGATL